MLEEFDDVPASHVEKTDDRHYRVHIAAPGFRKEDITVRQLLAHQAGLFAFDEPVDDAGRARFRELVRRRGDGEQNQTNGKTHRGKV